jgi:hypothetical protein
MDLFICIRGENAALRCQGGSDKAIFRASESPVYPSTVGIEAIKHIVVTPDNELAVRSEGRPGIKCYLVIGFRRIAPLLTPIGNLDSVYLGIVSYISRFTTH